MTYGQPYVGTDSGPLLLRQAGLRSMLTALGWRVEDLPDLDFDNLVSQQPSKSSSSHYTAGNAKNPEYVGPGAKLVAEMVEEKLRQGRFPLVLGGDHSIGIGSLAGLLRARPNTGIIWVDAHADLNTPQISESGNLHGMSVGLMMDGVSEKDEVASIPGFDWLSEYPRLKPDSIVYVGLRDVDSEERHLIHAMDIKAYTMREVDYYGIGKVMDMALQHLLSQDENRPLHLSYDIDAVDPGKFTSSCSCLRARACVVSTWAIFSNILFAVGALECCYRYFNSVGTRHRHGGTGRLDVPRGALRGRGGGGDGQPSQRRNRRAQS